MVREINRLRGGIVAALAGFAVVATGCSTTSSGNSGTGNTAGPVTAAGPASSAASPSAGSTGGATTSAVLAAGFKGAFEAPPKTGPAAQKGKKVWYISCGQAYAACAAAAVSFQEAGKVLGWSVTVVDGKADPSTAANAIKQGVAAHVDGIALFTFDCPSIKSALLQAKAAKVPVVNFGSLDCDDSAFGGQKLFAASVNEQGTDNQAGVWEGLGKARADFIGAKIGSTGGTVIDINETGQRAHQYQQLAFMKEIAIVCPNCKVVNVPFTFSQVPTAATAIWKAALLKNPGAKVVSWDTDALMGLGLATAIKQSGLGSNVLKVGAEGNLPNMDLIRAGDQTVSCFIPYGWYQWAAADTLNRLFSGQSASSLPSQGGGFQYIDKDHNLPAPGQVPTISIDYKALYTAVWAK